MRMLISLLAIMFTNIGQLVLAQVADHAIPSAYVSTPKCKEDTHGSVPLAARFGRLDSNESPACGSLPLAARFRQKLLTRLSSVLRLMGAVQSPQRGNVAHPSNAADAHAPVCVM